MVKKRGGNQALPLQYFGAAAQVSAGEGGDRMGISGNMVRPAIGGTRSTRTRSMKKRSTKTRGGFYPSVMGNFVAGASKYIVPLALFAGYKLMQKTQRTRKQRTRKQRTRTRKQRK